MAECVWPGLRSIGLLMKGRRRTQYSRKKKKDKERQTVKKKSSFFLSPLLLCTRLTLVGVDAAGRDLMAPSRGPSQHGLLTFEHYSAGPCGELSQPDLLQAPVNEVK